MKVLLYRYGSICEPDILSSFQAFGIDADIIDVEITNKKITNGERIDEISKRLNNESYLFVFSINFFPAISDVCNLYNVPYVGWVVDSPVPELFNKSIANPCNRIFCFDYKQFTDIHDYNPDCIFHLPLGTNVARWDSVISSISYADRAKYSSDISFVGSLYTELDPILKVKDLSSYSAGYIQGIYECQKQIQGMNIIEPSITTELVEELKEKLPEEFMPEELFVKNLDNYIVSQSILALHCSSLERIEFLSRLSEHFDVNLYTRSDVTRLLPGNRVHCHSGVATLTEMPKVFNLSKINLNITIRSIQTGVSLRLWDVMGCGGFLLTNYQEELAEILVPGEDYDYFGDCDELIDKCRFYLAHDDIRQKIARSGYEKVKQNHSYINRIDAMVRTLTI